MDAPVSQVFYLGNSRWTGDQQQVVYSKYNLTYATASGTVNETSPINTTTTGTSWGSSQLSYATASGGFSLSSVLSSTQGSPSTTYGGRIASFPDAQTTLGWVVSAGERLDGTGIPEVQFHIEQQAVVARTRKMRALWTIEASQDLKAYHNLDLERELTELLSKELSLEIDRELIEDIRMIAYGFGSNNRAGSIGGWVAGSLDGNYNSNNFGTEYGKTTGTTGTQSYAPSAFTWGNTNTQFNLGSVNSRNSNVIAVDLRQFAATTTAFAPQHIGHMYANLLAALNFASQDIYKSTQRGPGTVLITSPLMASILESASKLEGGSAREDAPSNIGGSKIEYKGKFAGKYDLIVDPLFPEDEIVMGYNGGNPMDTGFVYCPYIPLMPLPMVTDPGSFQPRKGIMTRYAKTAIQPASRFYRVIRLIGVGLDWLRPGITVSNSLTGLTNVT
jgi:hypothetical protein